MRCSNFLLAVIVAFALAACGSSTETTAPVDTVLAGIDTAEIPAVAETATASIPPTAWPTKTLRPSLTFTPSQDYSSEPCNHAKFLADASIPDDWEISPGSTFTKIWRMQNIGSCAWNSGYTLVFDHGDRMEAPDSQPLVPNVISPGRTARISVVLAAPNEEGTYQGFFKIRAPDGTVFGVGSNGEVAFWVKIVVKDGPESSLNPPKTKYVFGEGSIKGGAADSVEAVCPDGWVVTGGGFSAPKDLPVNSEYKGENGWIVWTSNPNASSRTLTAIAICLNLSSARTTGYQIGGAVQGGNQVTYAGYCLRGSVMTGGGYILKGTALQLLQSAPYDKGWKWTVKNEGDQNATYSVETVCLTGVTAFTTYVIETVKIEPGASGYGQAACPAGKMVSSGGWAFESDLQIQYSAWYSGKWRVVAQNTGTKTRSLEVYATCLSLS
ncbi:MAG: NBR1-Ig-like domain-containing protein [Anaerolineales bacterium]